MWPITLSGRLPIVDLVGRYLTNYLIGREPTPNRFAPFTPGPCDPVVLCGISTCFQVLSPCLGQVAHALLTRPPLEYTRFLPKLSSSISPFDLHVLSTPPAFVLSQDQTLMFNPSPCDAPYSLRLAKASAFSPISRRLTLRNLTVFFSLLCIVFKVRKVENPSDFRVPFREPRRLNHGFRRRACAECYKTVTSSRSTQELL